LPRTLPLAGETAAIISRRWPTGLASPFVFGRTGDFRKAWRSACKKAGVPELLFHDLRRSGIRNLIRRGVSQKTAMSISGHETISTFNRYNIVDVTDQREAFEALARETFPGKA
jgi:integrase